jgi:site-specific DNA-methyltransferase (adenine-specific)
MELLANGRVTLHCGDSREKLSLIADNSIDSVVTDPPYALVSISKRFGKKGAAPAKAGTVYARASSGFMQVNWDTGEVAFNPEFWGGVLRVMKPGAHICAFGGDRTFHRLACAIEDGGFEIRHSMSWLFGSGFPKSRNISKDLAKTEWCQCDD